MTSLLQVDKVQYISYIRELPTPVRRNAELALFSHQLQQAEATYLQAGMVYRAIELNLEFFNWERWVGLERDDNIGAKGWVCVLLLVMMAVYCITD